MKVGTSSGKYCNVSGTISVSEFSKEKVKSKDRLSHWGAMLGLPKIEL